LALTGPTRLLFPFDRSFTHIEIGNRERKKSDKDFLDLMTSASASLTSATYLVSLICPLPY